MWIKNSITFTTTLLFIIFYNTLCIAYNSQWGQDKFINERVFKNKKGLTFVDIGAYDGKYISNSYFFEKKLNWSGICIEPLPVKFTQLRKNRSCVCLNICIGLQSTTVPFFFVVNSPVLSGRVDTWEKEHEEFFNTSGKKIINVPSKPLSSVLKEHNISHIDYLSVDVEGGELDVLKSIDWETTHIVALTVENNWSKPETPDYLSAKGYIHIARLGRDDVWLHKNESHLFFPK